MTSYGLLNGMSVISANPELAPSSQREVWELSHKEGPVLSGQPARFGFPQLDESYFEKLAAFGLACVAAAGKLTLAALTPQRERRSPDIQVENCE